MMPPWAKFPTYERYTIGWRMGAGEDYLHGWYDFVDKLPADYESRLAYLTSQPPAPLNWGHAVWTALKPGEPTEMEYHCSPAETEELRNLGLIKADIAYHTWRSQQAELSWPWQSRVGDTPEKAARYGTRGFWFFSRHLNSLRGQIDLESVELPGNWKQLRDPLINGVVADNELDLNRGLWTLAQFFFAGRVIPPWEFGLPLSSFQDSFDNDMNYTDAFRLWIMCGFDDDEYLRQLMFTHNSIPAEWEDWFKEQTQVD